MDFGALPPEVNSAKMYSGPGIGSLLVAAASWDAIADELYSAASRSNTIISALTGRAWQGQASMAMATAAARYLAWMNATAAQAQHTAVQIRSAAGAFETAFAGDGAPAHDRR
nr:PPE family protein [Mycobacterium riyadhense]